MIQGYRSKETKILVQILEAILWCQDTEQTFLIRDQA